LIGVDRKWLAEGRNGAFDPKPTWAFEGCNGLRGTSGNYSALRFDVRSGLPAFFFSVPRFSLNRQQHLLLTCGDVVWPLTFAATMILFLSTG
jgi:hypothetical protein